MHSSGSHLVLQVSLWTLSIVSTGSFHHNIIVCCFLIYFLFNDGRFVHYCESIVAGSRIIKSIPMLRSQILHYRMDMQAKLTLFRYYTRRHNHYCLNLFSLLQYELDQRQCRGLGPYTLYMDEGRGRYSVSPLPVCIIIITVANAIAVVRVPLWSGLAYDGHYSYKI